MEGQIASAVVQALTRLMVLYGILPRGFCYSWDMSALGTVTFWGKEAELGLSVTG